MGYRENVKRNRLVRGLSQARLAELSGFSQNTISLIERGDSSPSVDTLETIARAMGLELVDLIGERERPANAELLIPIPFFSEGSFVDWEQDQGDAADDVYLVAGYLAAPERFAALIRTDTMYPTLWPNDVVVVDRSVGKPRSGSIVAFEFDGDCSVRRLRRIQKQLVLVADNAQYPPMQVAPKKNVRIIGPVVALIKRDLTSLKFR